MSKSSFFIGQPIFSQVLSYVSQDNVNRISSQHKADHYCKRFTTYNHLVTMLYGIFNHCTSLREVTTGLQAWESRINHLGLKYHPRKSTISDANSRRTHEVFEDIYTDLYRKFRKFLPDSRRSKNSSKLYIVDSTTITLFHDVLRGTGLPKLNGKKKGGIKVHTLMRSDEDVPCLIKYSAATACDVPFLKEINLPLGSVLVFDRGYRSFTEWNRFSEEGVTWISRLIKRSKLKIIQSNQISPAQHKKGVITDQIVELGNDHHKSATKVKARLIEIRDSKKNEVFQFVTNNFQYAPNTIGEFYRRRWQIELLFKRIKQNYPVQFFLGDSENAIKIQIWCALIADLILKIIASNVAKKWSFSNLASMIRLHLMTYIDLKSFLKNPEEALTRRNQKLNQISLFPT